MNIEDFGENGQYQVGRVVSARMASYEAARTEPPMRFTQSDLIDEMMAAYKYAANPKDRALLKEISGLGTSRTREPTITGLINRAFLILDKSRRARSRVELKPSESATTIIANLPSVLTDPSLTAKWEMAFKVVEQGKASPDDVKRYMKVTLDELISEAKGKGKIVVSFAPPGGNPGKNQFSKKPAGVKAAGAGVVGNKRS